MRLRRPEPLRRRPHFWVVVPCYKYGRLLEDCVGSIVNQPEVTSTVLIMDDASPDDSFEVAQRLAEAHPNVVARRNEKNLGHIATYNRGLADADSDYVLLLSADDVLATGALARAGALLDAEPSLGLAYGAPDNFTDRPGVRPDRTHSWTLWSGGDWIRAQCQRGLSIIYSPEAVVRTEVHHAVGYYDPSLPHTADLDLWLRVAAVSGVGRVNGPYQAHRRIHGENMMTSNYNTLLVDLIERARTYEQFLSRLPWSDTEVARLRRIVQRRLSLEAFAWVAEHHEDYPPEVLRSYAAFGESLYEDHARLAGWQELANLYRGHASFVERAMGLKGRLNREFGSRIRWHRWVHLGV